MVSNMSLTSNRNRASSPANSRAWVCSSSTAWATWPISSVVYTGNGCGIGSAPPGLSRGAATPGLAEGAPLFEGGGGYFERPAPQHPQRHAERARHQQDDGQCDHDGGQ